MDTTQELNEFLKSHPVEKKTEVPQEVKDKLRIKGKEKCVDYHAFVSGGEYAYQLAQEEIELLNKEVEYQKRRKQRIFDIVKAGLSWHREQRKELKEQLAAKDKEIERMKGLIEKWYKCAMSSMEGNNAILERMWQQFKHNNL